VVALPLLDPLAEKLLDPVPASSSLTPLLLVENDELPFDEDDVGAFGDDDVLLVEDDELPLDEDDV
jgi:hypothetical protein